MYVYVHIVILDNKHVKQSALKHTMDHKPSLVNLPLLVVKFKPLQVLEFSVD